MSGGYTIYMILCILINTECGKTESSCPSSVLRKAVANQSCLVIHNYHCLEIYPTPKHQQGCRLPKRIHEGKYPIFDGAFKYINGIDCPQDRYQPKASFSYEINKCIYVKSLCTEEGQVIYSNGSTTEDRSCRCDYTKGYNFVIKPKERCYCIPSVEDCSCYKQQCPNDNQVLSPDYECIISVNSAVFNCPKIESINEQEDNHTKAVTVILSEIHGHRPVRNLSNLTAVKDLLVLLILFTPFYGILIHAVINNWYNRFFNVQRFVSDLEDRTCNEGDSVTFSCEVTNKTAKVKWYKDGLRLQQSRNHKIESHNGLHTFRIVITSDMYRGTYSVRTRGKVSRSAELEFTDIPVQTEKFVKTEPNKSVVSDQKICVEIEPQKSVDLVQTNFVETDPKKSVDSDQNKSVESNQQFVETDPKKSVRSDQKKSVESYSKTSVEAEKNKSVESEKNKSVESDLEEHGVGKLNSYVEEEDKSEKQQLAIGRTIPVYPSETATTESIPFGGTVQLYTQPESDQGPREGVPEKLSNQDIHDAVILYTLEDEGTAKEFMKHIYSLKDEIGIPDLGLIPHREFMTSGSTFNKFKQLFDTNRFIFIFVTEQFNSSEFDNYLGETLLQESFMKQNKLYRIIPVSVDGPEHMPFYLQSLIPINYYHYKQSKDKGKEDTIYVRMLASLFKKGRQQHLPI